MIDYNSTQLENFIRYGVVGEKRVSDHWFMDAAPGDRFFVLDRAKMKILGNFSIMTPVQESLLGGIFEGHRPLQAAALLSSDGIIWTSVDRVSDLVGTEFSTLESRPLEPPIESALLALTPATKEIPTEAQKCPKFTGHMQIDGFIWGAGARDGSRINVRVNDLPYPLIMRMQKQFSILGYETELYDGPNAISREQDLKLRIHGVHVPKSALPRFVERKITSIYPSAFLEGFIQSRISVTPNGRRCHPSLPLCHTLRLKIAAGQDAAELSNYLTKVGIVHLPPRGKLIEISPLSSGREPFRTFFASLAMESEELSVHSQDVDKTMEEIQKEVLNRGLKRKGVQGIETDHRDKGTAPDIDNDSLYQAHDSQTEGVEPRPSKLFVFTACNDTLWARWIKSVLNGRSLEDVAPSLSGDELMVISNQCRDVPLLFFWGMELNPVRLTLFNKIHVGDYMLAYRGGEYKFLFRVAHLANTNRLAQSIWGRAIDTPSWELVLILMDRVKVDISRRRFNELMGFKEEWFPSGTFEVDSSHCRTDCSNGVEPLVTLLHKTL